MSSDLAKKTVEEGSYGEAAMNLADFIVKNDLAMTTFTLPVNAVEDEYYARFDDSIRVLWSNNSLITVLGVGFTKVEAIEDYKKKIAGRSLFKSPPNIEIKCPLFWLPEADPNGEMI